MADNQGFSVVMLHPVEFATDNSCAYLAPQKLSVLRQVLEYGKIHWNIQTYQDAAITISQGDVLTSGPTIAPSPPPTRPTPPTATSVPVFFRLDDVQSWWCEEPARAVMNVFEAEGVPLNVGLIAGFLSEWSSLTPFLRTKATSPYFQMISMSNMYTSYQGQTLAWQQNDLAQSKVNINTFVGVTPTAFIPPMDLYDATTFDAMITEGIKVFSPMCIWNPPTSGAAGTALYCPAGANSKFPYFESNGVTTLAAGAVLGDAAYLSNPSGPASAPAALQWMESQIANQGFSVMRMSPFDFSADGTCTTVNTAKLDVLRTVLQQAKGTWQVKTFKEMNQVTSYSLTPSPTARPTALPTASRTATSSLKLNDAFTSLANWDKNMDGPSSSCVLKGALGTDPSHVACSLTYCPTCFASQIRVSSTLRSVVMPSSSGLYWIGFRLRVPSSWKYDGQSQSSVLMQVMRGDKSSDEFPIFALSLDKGASFSIQTCGSSATGGSTSVTAVCTKSASVSALALNKWTDWVVRLNMNYNTNGQGAVDVWVNGELKVSSRPVLTSFNVASPPFLQFGISNTKWNDAATNTDQSQFCPSYFSDGYVNGRCYRYSTTLDTWNDASAACKGKGGRLVSSVDSFTYDWIQRRFNPSKQKTFWMGYNDIAKEGTYVWDSVSNSNNYYKKWDSGEPAKGTSSNCAYAFGSTGSMRSGACTTKREYICELDVTTKDVDYYCPSSIKDAYYSGYCYSLSSTKATWADAKSRCNANGGWLTSMQSEDIYHWFADKLISTGESLVWIGLNDIASEGTFVWANGDAPGYIRWDKNEPSGDDCVVILRSGMMRDRSCSSQYNYVCQTTALTRSAAPTPAPLPSMAYQVDIAHVKVGDSSSCFNEVSTSDTTSGRTCVSTFSDTTSVSSSSSGTDSDSSGTSRGDKVYLTLLITSLILIAAVMLLVVAMFMRQSSAITAAVSMQIGRLTGKDYSEVTSETDDLHTPTPFERYRGSRFFASSPMHAKTTTQRGKASDIQFGEAHSEVI